MPPMPARAEAMPKPSILVRATSMPAAAAARSLARTARNRRPVAPRRRLTTARPSSTKAITANAVNRQ